MRRSATDTRGFAWVALVVVGVLTILLWAGTLFQLVGASTRFGAVHTAPGRVASCPGGVLAGPCTVTIPDGQGVPRTRPLDRPGLIGVAPGDEIAVWVDAQDRAIAGGWRPWADAALLLALAAATTGGTLAWVGRILRHGDTPYTPSPADLAGLDSPQDVLSLERLSEWREPDRPGPQPPQRPQRPQPGLRDGRRGSSRPPR